MSPALTFNIRHVSHISERIAPLLSLFSNAVLATLLLREKSQALKSYNRVLLQNLAADCVFSLVSMTIEMQLEMNKGVYIFVVNGVFKKLSPAWHFVMIGVWMASFALTLLIVPIEFFFRYMLLCRGYLLKTWQLFGLGSLAVLLAVLVALPLVAAVASVNDHPMTFGHLMTDPIWFDDYGQRAVFFGADKRNPYFIAFLTLSIVYNTVIYGFCISCGLATYLFLKESGSTMSSKARYMQTQLNRLMLAEALSVTIVGNFPVAICMLVLLFDVTCVGLGVCMTILFAWIPIINPLTSIFFVTPYRRRLLGACFDRRILDNARSYSATVSTPVNVR